LVYGQNCFTGEDFYLSSISDFCSIYDVYSNYYYYWDFFEEIFDLYTRERFSSKILRRKLNVGNRLLIVPNSSHNNPQKPPKIARIDNLLVYYWGNIVFPKQSILVRALADLETKK
jgi:hypothetical protein